MFEELKADEKTSLNHESGIIWLQDPNNFRFVRETFTKLTYPKGISDQDKQRLERQGGFIGYANLEDDTPFPPNQHHIPRRIFTLQLGDLVAYESDCPIEAVDPLTVKAKVLGKRNSRAKGQ
jgi:hypothetical protein